MSGFRRLIFQDGGDNPRQDGLGPLDVVVGIETHAQDHAVGEGDQRHHDRFDIGIGGRAALALTGLVLFALSSSLTMFDVPVGVATLLAAALDKRSNGNPVGSFPEPQRGFTYILLFNAPSLGLMNTKEVLARLGPEVKKGVTP